jgi:uncharacterized protein YbjT (DUF2867 family)
MSNSQIMIAGATRGTGLEIARVLRAQGSGVLGMARGSSSTVDLEDLGVEVVIGDAFNREDFDRALSGKNISALVLSLGGKRGEPRVDLIGTENAVAAAIAAGVSRVIMLGAIGAGDSFGAMSEKAQEILGPVMEIKTAAEKVLTDSGLDYTILRGGALNNDPATGRGMLTEDRTLIGTISRADWAQLVVDCLEDEATFGKIYGVVNEDMVGITAF